jgi:hypothetical protein
MTTKLYYLQHQRLLAAQAIQKSLETMKTPVKRTTNQHSITPPTQDKSWSSLYPTSSGKSFDFSTMGTEQSIVIENTPTKQKCSFEPTEFAARSTIEIPKRRTQLSADVEQLLASSFVESVRNLSSASFRESLAKTADMSKMSSVQESVDSMDSFLNHEAAMGSAAIDWMAEKEKELTQLENETFHDINESRLREDEKAWDQECAPIPGRLVTNNDMSVKSTRPMDDYSCFSYMAASNMSLDNWNKRSDNLMDILTQKSPPQRTPIPLVQADSTTSNYSDELMDDDKENSDVPNLSAIPKLLCECF